MKTLRIVTTSTMLAAGIVATAAITAGTAVAGGYGNGWGPAVPRLLVGGGQVPGGCPIESPARNFLYTAQNPGTLDIFVNQYDAAAGAFEPANPLPAPINSDIANDFCPTPMPDGVLYFVSSRSSGNCGGPAATTPDMQRAILNPATGWTATVNLGCYPDGPNTPGTELSPAIIETRWGTFLFFSTDYHTGNQDIYWSYQRADGSFSKGKRLGYPINTMYDDRQPNLTQDGRQIVFASNRPSFEGDDSGFDIFYANRRSLLRRWRRVTNLSETVPFDTVDEGETRPSFSWDEERINYGSGGVWVTERN